VMAAILAEIKSRMLLPQPQLGENLEEDPRAELIRRLQEYERYKKAAEDLDKLPRMERDTFSVMTDASTITVERPLPSVSMSELFYALTEVLKRAELKANHQIYMDALSVREKMSYILTMIQDKDH